jgi:Response regulators consisting of a CheY-like receiver domain and a winged-helix DNA-binding domain
MYSQEKRQTPRLDVLLSVTYDDPESFLEDYAFNASEGGVFVATNKRFEVGDEISFQVSFPGLLKPFLCHGQVCWQRKPDDPTNGEPAGIGVSFLTKSSEESQNIKGLVQKLSEPTPIAAQQMPFKILLLEDDDKLKEMYHSALVAYSNLEIRKHRSVIIHDAMSGDKAWEMIQAEAANDGFDLAFDMIIVKIDQPYLKGQELIKLIRDHESFCALPIIATGHDSPENQKAAFKAGADMFLRQPVVLANFFQSLRRFLFV